VTSRRDEGAGSRGRGAFDAVGHASIVGISTGLTLVRTRLLPGSTIPSSALNGGRMSAPFARMQATDRNSRHQRFIGLVVFGRSQARQTHHLSAYKVAAKTTIPSGKDRTTRESTVLSP
jgi:hypothetical protein